MFKCLRTVDLREKGFVWKQCNIDIGISFCSKLHSRTVKMVKKVVSVFSSDVK